MRILTQVPPRAQEILRPRSSSVPTPAARLVLAYLRKLSRAYGGGIFPAIATIAARAQVSERTAQRAIKQLAELGFLAIVPDATVKTGRRFLVGQGYLWANLPEGFHPQVPAHLPEANGTPRQNVTPTVGCPAVTQSESSPPRETTTPSSSTATTTTILTTSTEEIDQAVEWVVGRTRNVRNPGALRYTLKRRGLAPEVLAEFRAHRDAEEARRRAQEAFQARARVRIDPEAKRAMAAEHDAEMGAFWRKAAEDVSHPLHALARRRVGAVAAPL